MSILNPLPLDTLCIQHGTDKGSRHPYTPHNYAPTYERFFERLRHQPLKILEIGVGGGESIRTWLDYFPVSKVFGIDLVAGTNPFNTPGSEQAPERYTFTQGDQASPAFWAKFYTDHGGSWDIIIDDGGHEIVQIETSFRCMWPHINYGGLYCIEDLAYAKPFDLLKTQVDRVHTNTEVEFLHCFYELAIIKKKDPRPPCTLTTPLAAPADLPPAPPPA